MSRLRPIPSHPSFTSIPINEDLFRINKGREMIGQVRRGMDGLWYPELPGEANRAAALHRLILAHQATIEFVAAINGRD